MIELPCNRPDLRLYVGDSSNNHIPGQYDVAFADPPYNLSRNYGDHCSDHLSQPEYDTFTCDWMRQVIQSLTFDGTLWVVINPDQLFSVLRAAKLLALTKPGTNAPHSHCIWHYRFGQHTHTNFIPSHAHVLRFSQGNPPFNSPLILEPSDRALIYNDSRTTMKSTGKPGERTPFTVWQDGDYAAVPAAALSVWQGSGFHRITGNHPERSKPHDNQLPLALVKRCLQASTPINGKTPRVLDPFLGSGTSAVAALQLGHLFTGIELSKQIAEDALVRIRRDTQG